MVCGSLPSFSQTRFFCIYILSPKPCCPVLFLTRQALENPSLCNLRPNSTIFFTRSLFHLLFRVTFAMPSYNGSKNSTIVHQNPSRSSSTYYSNNSSGSRSSSHSTHSHTTTYTMDYSTSSGPYGHDQAQYRSPYASKLSPHNPRANLAGTNLIMQRITMSTCQDMAALLSSTTIVPIQALTSQEPQNLEVPLLSMATSARMTGARITVETKACLGVRCSSEKVSICMVSAFLVVFLGIFREIVEYMGWTFGHTTLYRTRHHQLGVHD